MAKGSDPTLDQADRIAAEIGKLLRARRNELGVTQSEIARYLGVSQQQIGKYEKGIGRIPADNLLALCERLRIDPGTVFLPRAVADDASIFGFADAGGASYDAGGIDDGDVRALVRAFERISDKAVRRKVLDLVTTIAESAGPLPPVSPKRR